MKKINLLLLFVFLFFHSIQSQKTDFSSIEPNILDLGEVGKGNKDFTGYSRLKTILKDVEIVMLGEQSHGEATTFSTKIKLIKYLHQEMGFDLLVFESGIYDCQKAWELISQGADVKTSLAKSIFMLWSTTREFFPLTQYVEDNLHTAHPLKVLGFDNQFTGRLSEKQFCTDLSEYVNELDPSWTTSREWKHFIKSMALLARYESDSLKKRDIASDTTYIRGLTSKISEATQDSLADFWIQSLKSAKAFLSDMSLKTDFRDKQMAENLIWLKERHPNSKIICWGATSHFLYNSKVVKMKSPLIQAMGGKYYKGHLMMGSYIKDTYGPKVFTVGFTAYQGKYNMFYTKKIRKAKKGTLEGLLGESKGDNLFLPLDGAGVGGYRSRPLGNRYMKNDIDLVMDAVVFNRYMKPPRLDANFFLKIYPENKFIKPAPETPDE